MCCHRFYSFLKLVVLYYPHRTANLRKTSQTLPSMSTLLVTSGFMDVTAAVAAGISPSMALSAALLGLLRARSTCELARTTIFTVTAILKAIVTTFTRERCEWDSGLETATRVTQMPTPIRVGLHCPGFLFRR